MTHEDMRQAAMKVLKKAFDGDVSVPAHVVQAAVGVLGMKDMDSAPVPALTHGSSGVEGPWAGSAARS